MNISMRRYFVVSDKLQDILLSVLVVGLFIQLVGELFNNDGSRHATQTYILLFVPAIFLATQRMSLPIWREPTHFMILCLFSWVLLLGMIHPGSEGDTGYWMKVILLTSLYLFALASLVRRPRMFNWLLIAVVVVVAAFAWATIYYQFGVLDKSREYSWLRLHGRLFQLGWNGFGDLKHPVIAGLYFGVFAVILLYLFVSFKLRLWQAGALLFALIGVFAYVLLTFTRGAWFSTVAGGLVVLLLFSSMKSRSLIALGLVLIALGLFSFWPELQFEQKRGLSGRDFIWREWVETLSGFWMLGSGAGADFVYRVNNSFTVFHAHSLYLQLWFEYGIVGFLLFVLLLLSLLHKGWKCRANPLARLGLGLLVYATFAMITDVSAIFSRPGPWWVVVWLPIGILLGVQQPAAERKLS